MPPWLSIALPIILLVLSVVTHVVVNIHTKFAPSKDVAFRELKQLHTSGHTVAPVQRVWYKGQGYEEQ